MKLLKSFCFFTTLPALLISLELHAQTKADFDPQEAIDAIQNITNIVESADNLINQIIPEDNSAGTDQQVVNVLSPEELAKWQYVYNFFTARLNNVSTVQQIARFFNDYAKHLAAPTIVIYMALVGGILDQLKALTTPTTTTEQPTNASKAVSTTLNLGSGSVKYIATPIIGALLTYKIIKFISSKIEKSAETCNIALIDFIKNWDQHKAQTPDVLCPLFDHLNIELNKNNGKLPIIDAILAQNIIEAIISSASIYNSI